jgi:TRAP-type C4-dicarboxylate transport system substrate-binding protein
MMHIRLLTAVVMFLMMSGLAHGQNVRLKIATIAPEGSVWLEEAHKAADEIESRTDGRVSFRFYPGGVMGSDATVLRKMRIGQLHGGAVLPGPLAALVPDVELYAFPMLFRSYDEVDHVRKHMDARIIDVLADNDLVAFGLVETGFVYLMSSEAATSIDDLKGRKVWIPEGDAIGKAIFDAAGLSPVSLAVSDVMTGLQTGLVDTVAAPPVGAVALQWFTKAKYVTDLPITYVAGILVLSEQAWSKIGSEDQIVVGEELRAMSSDLDRRSRIDNRDAREALARQGVTFVVPAEATVGRWQEIAADATRKLTGQGRYDRALVEEIQRLLDDYRSEHAGD